MTDRRSTLATVLFWSGFAVYTAGVVVWLVVGLVPSVVNEGSSLHDWLHRRAGDALLAEGEVTLRVENHDEKDYIVRLQRPDGSEVTPGRVVRAHGNRDYEVPDLERSADRIVARSVDDPDDEVDTEVRFESGGAHSLRIDIHEDGAHLEKVGGPGGGAGFAQRLADASHHADHLLRVVLETAFSALNLGLGLLLLLRRPRDRTARLLAVGMIGTAATFNHQAHVVAQEYLLGDWWDPHLLFHLGSGLAYMFAVVVFPDGRLVPFTRTRRSEALKWAAYGLAALVIALFVVNWTSETHPGQSFFTVLFGIAIPVVGVAAQTYRLRLAEDPERRQQSRLLRVALLPMLALGAVYPVLLAVSRGETESWIEDTGLAVFPALFALVPLALVMGILRYRLWEIDVLISKTLLSVGLVAFIGAVYVVVVVVIGRDVRPGDSVAFKIVATAIAAVAFEPVRERLERLANRLVYGERATPYEVVAGFADRLSSVLSVDEVLPRTAEAVALGVGAVASRVTTFLPGGGERTVRWPEGDVTSSFTRVVDVLYGGRPVGEIAVAKGPGERLLPAEEGLLTSLATQAGLAFNNARLAIELQDRLEEMSRQAEDLRASRQRIVTAREVLRQRVVQLIHDRVETHLQVADEQLAHAEALLPDEPDRALECFDSLLTEGGRSLDALRDLARGIFPAVLADQGVMPALHAYLVQVRLPVDVDIEGWEERFDPEAEAGVYFCVVQALANAGAYAAGSRVVVRLTARDHRLEFSVADEGPGVEQEVLSSGADIQNMRDRVEAVGGEFTARSVPGEGTVVSGWVPARVPVGAGASADGS